MADSLGRTLPNLARKPRILVCAPSNAATDELLQRIMDHGFLDFKVSLPTVKSPLPNADAHGCCPLPLPIAAAHCLLRKALCPLPAATGPLTHPSAHSLPVGPLPIACCRLPTAHCVLSTALCLLPIAHCQLLIAYCPLPTVYCPLQTTHCLLPTTLADCPVPTDHCPLPHGHCTDWHACLMSGEVQGNVYRPNVVRIGSEEAPVSERAKDVWVDGLITRYMDMDTVTWEHRSAICSDTCATTQLDDTPV